MTFARNLWRDLVEKRLWPAAVVLLVALIAIPVVIGTGSSKPASVPSAPGAGGAVPRSATAQVSLDQTTSAKLKSRAGKVRDPFKPLHVVPQGGSGGTGKSAVAKAAEEIKAAGTTTTKTPTGTTTPTPTTTPTGTTPTGTSSGDLIPLEWVARVRFGSHTAMKTYKNVAGVTPLPSSSYNLVTFLGVKKDTKTATFLVRSLTLVTGDGTCQPSPANCELLELPVGKSALLTRRAGANGLKRYRIRLQGLRLRRMADTTATARSAKKGLAADLSTVAVAGG